MPNISVLVPVYNAEALVGQAVRNILLQTLRPTIVEFLDDGSTDGTWSCLMAEAETLKSAGVQVKLLRNEINRGRGQSRNILLKSSSAEVVSWYDIDDLWGPAKLEEQAAAWSSLSKELQARTILYCDYRVFHGNGDVIGRSVSLPPQIDVHQMLAVSGGFRTIQLQTTFGAREAFLIGGGFQEDLNYGEDFAFVVSHLSAGGVLRKCEEMGAESVFYFQDLSRVNTREIYFSQKLVCERFKGQFDACGVDVDEYLSYKRLLYNFNACLAQRDFESAKAIVFGAVHWRRNKAVRDLLRRQLGRLRAAQSKLKDRIASEPEEEQRKAASEVRRIVLREREPFGYEIFFNKDEVVPKKIVLEWLNDNQGVLEVKRANNAQEEISVSQLDVLRNYIRGARRLRVKLICSSSSIMRTFRVSRNSDGVIGLK